MKPILLAFCLVLPVGASEFESDWEGTRPWIGPEFWANPNYDWEMKDGVVIANAGPDRLLHLLSRQPTDPNQGFELSVTIDLLTNDKLSNPESVWAGMAVGVQGMMSDPRHIAVAPMGRIEAGVRANGFLFLGKDAVSKVALSGEGPVALKLVAKGGQLKLTGSRAGASVELGMAARPEVLKGNVCLAAFSTRKAGDKRGPIRMSFRDWRISGEGIGKTDVEPFGPILWTQYTREGSAAKLSVQMAPVGKDDPDEVVLDLKDNGGWKEIGKAAIDPLARTAVFRVEVPTGDVGYRVRYPWKGGDSEWTGVFREDPATSGRPLRIGVFSCDNGYAFPLSTMTRNVSIQDPGLVFYAGDQIYESFGGFGPVRQPLEKAMLDYLRKWYQFGWTWREVLRDRPSVILPDDHDVFQGNLWGSGGKYAAKPEQGGYMMPPEWVNAVQRTQTAHLPDPVDPAPIKRGIGVYFTEMRWGGLSMAILEDRKWKSGPSEVLPGGARELTAAEVDVEGASLLGARQERFLKDWSARTADEPLRLVLSQTIFSKGHTHTGPQLTRNRFDWDSNGWPQAGRRRALQPLMGDTTLMLHGDQHLGLLVRQGVDTWGDGPWALMVPGTANGWPRAWWPENGQIAGDFSDPFGNKFTVLAAGNPEKGSNLLKPKDEDPPEKVAHLKGSGYGIVEIAPDRKSARIEMWRYGFDASKPEPKDQFEGFPQMLRFGQK